MPRSIIPRPILRFILRNLPLIQFSRLNAWLFRAMGYQVHPTARIYASSEIMGDIEVEIGPRTFIGHSSLITGGKAKIHIGSDCDISDRVGVFCGTHTVASDGPRAAGPGIGKDIIIGNGVWIGFGALILPGVTIGDHAIVAAGAVVHKNVAARTIVGGNPIRVIRSI